MKHVHVYIIKDIMPNLHNLNFTFHTSCNTKYTYILSQSKYSASEVSWKQTILRFCTIFTCNVIMAIGSLKTEILVNKIQLLLLDLAPRTFSTYFSQMWSGMGSFSQCWYFQIRVKVLCCAVLFLATHKKQFTLQKVAFEMWPFQKGHTPYTDFSILKKVSQ